jgi:hypothetical protein
MQRRIFSSLLVIFLICFKAHAQDDLLKMIEKSDTVSKGLPVLNTFRTSRIVNAPTPEGVGKKELDFRVTHRFGNIAGTGGGYDNFFGLDEAANIRIAFDGISDKLTVGFGRSKVNGLLDGSLKYRVLRQKLDNSMPVTVSVMGIAGYNSKRSPEKTINRLSYVYQAIIARKFSNKFSLEVVPVMLHRNLVDFGDKNNTYALGAGGRFSVSRSCAILLDYYYIFSQYQKDNNFSAPLGIGFEIETGGHVFHMDFTNATGIMENQFIADTRDSWLDGHFKWGFNISRIFKF